MNPAKANSITLPSERLSSCHWLTSRTIKPNWRRTVKNDSDALIFCQTNLCREADASTATTGISPNRLEVWVSINIGVYLFSLIFLAPTMRKDATPCGQPDLVKANFMLYWFRNSSDGRSALRHCRRW